MEIDEDGNLSRRTSDQNWTSGESAAALLGGAFKFYSENNVKMQVNQLSLIDGSHSNVYGPGWDTVLDIKYASKGNSVPWNVSLTTGDSRFDVNTSIKIVNSLKGFGYTDVISLNPDGTAALPGTRPLTNHLNHLHFQGFSPNVISVTFGEWSRIQHMKSYNWGNH